MEDGIIMTNPADGHRRRGRKAPDTITRSERPEKIKPFTEHDLAIFIATAREVLLQRDALVFEMIADSGVRPAEALGIQWGDVDSAVCEITIERAIDLTTHQEKGTKTGAGRVVDITPEFAARLSSWQAHVKAEALMRGRDVSPWVFGSDAGTPLDYAAVAKRFAAVIRRARLPRHSPYDLRHTYATEQLASREDLIYVANQLGHSNPATTLRYYVHWMPRGDKGASQRMGARRRAAFGRVIGAASPEHGTKIWHHAGRMLEDATEAVEKTGAGGGS